MLTLKAKEAIEVAKGPFSVLSVLGVPIILGLKKRKISGINS